MLVSCIYCKYLLPDFYSSLHFLKCTLLKEVLIQRWSRISTHSFDWHILCLLRKFPPDVRKILSCILKYN